MNDDIDLTMEDFLTEEEFEALRQQRQEAYYNASLSSDSLGISDRDFF